MGIKLECFENLLERERLVRMMLEEILQQFGDLLLSQTFSTFLLSHRLDSFKFLAKIRIFPEKCVPLHPKFNKMKILITGASGFIGSFIVEEALKRGFDTWAAVRKSSSRAFLQDERIHFIELNLSSKTQLVEQLRDQQFDYVVHAAGVTKCLNKADFHRINTEGTKNLVEALLEVKMPLKRFVFVGEVAL